MTRKEFLQLIWYRLLLPVVIIFTVYTVVKLLLAIADAGIYQALLVIVTLLAASLILLIFLGLLISQIQHRLPISIKSKLLIPAWILQVAVACFAGYQLVKLWQKDPVLTCIMVVIFILQYLLRRKSQAQL